VSSQPPNEPGPLRHLGLAPRSGSGLAVAGLAALLILIAVPLYLWRRPRPLPASETAHTELDAGVADAAPAPVAEPKPGTRLTLTEAKAVRCGGRSGRWSKDRCDDLPAVGDSLARAIRENIACAPVAAAPYTVSFVLSINFDKKKTHLWAGRSGSLRRRAASDLIKCVEHALPPVDWPATQHQYIRYDLNIIASYPAVSAASGPASSAR